MTDRLARLGFRRVWLAMLCLPGLAACGSTTLAVGDVDGLPCMTFRKTHRPNRICAAQPAPSAEVAQQVKTFTPIQDDAQVLVHWLERASATRPLTLSVDGRAVAQLVPGGLVRLRLRPGPHDLSVAWGEQHAAWRLQAQAGRVQFAEVAGRFKFWDISFGWETPDENGARRRASTARVIADVDLRGEPAMGGGSVMPTP